MRVGWFACDLWCFVGFVVWISGICFGAGGLCGFSSSGGLAVRGCCDLMMCCCRCGLMILLILVVSF